MENCDRENIDKLLEIRQIHQYFPRQSFVPYGSYILGKKFLIEADPKPLVPLLGNKSLHSLPLRILHFQLRLARYEYEIFHIPGKSLVMADTLSHSPIQSTDSDVHSFARGSRISYGNVYQQLTS